MTCKEFLEQQGFVVEISDEDPSSSFVTLPAGVGEPSALATLEGLGFFDYTDSSQPRKVIVVGDMLSETDDPARSSDHGEGRLGGLS